MEFSNIPRPAGDATECRCAGTDELLGYSPLHTADDLRQMLQAARQAQKT